MIEQLLKKRGLPFCVDLDGTLIRGNSFWALWKQRQGKRFLSLSWPKIKSALAERAVISSENVRYNMALISLLRRLHGQGVPLFLVTGANQRVAEQVASAMGVFQEAIGSSASVNLVGPQKAAYLQKRFGIFGYTYIGDSWRDLPVWKGSRDIFVISGNWTLSCYLRLWKQKSQSLIFFPY